MESKIMGKIISFRFKKAPKDQAFAKTLIEGLKDNKTEKVNKKKAEDS